MGRAGRRAAGRPGPWVPPLPDAPPPLSPRALTWFGVAAVTLMISAAAATVVMIDSAVARAELPSLDERYLGSVRDNSTLTGRDVDDDALIRTGHDVCATAGPPADAVDRAGHHARARPHAALARRRRGRGGRIRHRRLLPAAHPACSAH